MIGQNVFYLDFMHECVQNAVCTGTHIGTGGYLIYDLQTAEGPCAREKAFVFKEEEDAEQALRLMQPIYQKMKDIQEQAKQKIDTLRQELLGKPEFDESAHA